MEMKIHISILYVSLQWNVPSMTGKVTVTKTKKYISSYYQSSGVNMKNMYIMFSGDQLPPGGQFSFKCFASSEISWHRFPKRTLKRTNNYSVTNFKDTMYM